MVLRRNKMGLYKVTTLVQFKHVYFVEGQNLDHVLDEVSMRESGSPDDYFEETSQEYLNEIIIDGAPATMQEFFDHIQNTQGLCSQWMGEKLIHKMKYDEPEQVPDTITVSVYDEPDTSQAGHEAFKQMGTSLILGKPSIGLPGDLEKVRYGRWNQHLRGY
jgi:hypothetical protein